MSVTNPAVIINHYLSYVIEQKVPEYFGMPMFFLPSTPSDIQSLYEGFPQAKEDQPFAVYERMFKMRKGSFPHCKCEQLLYYLYKNGSRDSEQAAILFETTQLIYDLMDRGDESAQEVNAWQAANLNSNGKYQPIADETEFNPVFFHETRVFQLEETRDIIDFATAQTYFGNKIIVDYEYHAQDFNNAEPLFKNGSLNESTDSNIKKFPTLANYPHNDSGEDLISGNEDDYLEDYYPGNWPEPPPEES